MFSFVIYFIAALILFLIFLAVIVVAVTLGITFAKTKDKKNVVAVDEFPEQDTSEAASKEGNE